MDRNLREIFMGVNRHSYIFERSGAWPTFNVDQREFFPVHACIQLDPRAGERRNVSKYELPNLLRFPLNIDVWLRDANNLAFEKQKHGDPIVGALPTFEQGLRNGVEHLAITFIREEADDFRKVHPDELKALGIHTHVQIPHERFKAINKYVFRYLDGYYSGFPTFTDNDGLIHFIAIKHGFADDDHVPDSLVHAHLNYGFNTDHTKSTNDLTAEFRARIFFALRLVMNSLGTHSAISDEEIRKVVQASYHNLRISRMDNDDFVGWTNGDDIWLDESEFTDLDNESIAETLIHELLHVAGETHIDKLSTFDQFANYGCGNDIPNIPDDAKEYWMSAPLRAECSIRGQQTLRLH
ncbi:hypothetical protein P4K96_27625 [Bacillus cereus]|nr:hypothetical protein [Bacillus cereus]